MNNITFRGEINEMSSAFFVRELEGLAPRSAATVYLHTPGGDIYAGGEMVNAMRAAVKRGCRVSLELGSVCASMGAALLAAARASGCAAKCHRNSEVMFHGCWSLIVGGADELTDQAKAMRDFNECVKRDLRAVGILDTDEWFAADRQKWLNADELLALGLVDEIDGEEVEDPELKDAALKIAASLNHKEQNMNEEIQAETAETAAASETEQPKPTEDAAETEPVADPAVVENPAAETAAEPQPDIEAKVAELANRRFAGLQAKHEKMISDLTNERDAARADLAKSTDEATSLRAEVEKLTADLAAVRDQLAKSESVRESVVVGALAPAAEPPTLEAGLAACKSLAERAAFIASGNYRK